MSAHPAESARRSAAALHRAVTRLGEFTLRCAAAIRNGVEILGGVALLMGDVLQRSASAFFSRKSKLNRTALIDQMVRVGVRGIPIVMLVQIFIGIILSLQMAPVLQQYGQLDRVADIIAIAIFRELGPLISAILLSGFAGASIAAELGAMVEGEEIKAMRAFALDPIRFLVAPRVWATVVMLTALTIIADVVGVLGGWLTSTMVLNVDSHNYINATRAALTHRDFLTGLVKAGVFGALISLIACYQGLNVTGGAEGVGRATTATVVKSIVALIATDCVFTAVFYALGW